jgi:hypothetical protein
VPTSFEKDRAREAQHSARQHDKINMSQTKSALHRTRLRVLLHKNFSVLFFLQTDTPERAAAGFLSEFGN